MDPLGVAVGKLISEQTPEMTFAEDDPVIDEEPDVQQLQAHRGDDAKVQVAAWPGHPAAGDGSR